MATTMTTTTVTNSSPPPPPVPLSSSTATPSSDGGCNVPGARSLAQEVVSWYLHHLDPLDPHALNVEHNLRDPVISLTVSILQHHQLDIKSNKKKNGAAGQGNGSAPAVADWKEYLRLDENTSLEELFRSEKILKQVEKLGPRQKVRMEAFLRGVSLAVESETQSAPIKRQHSNDSGDGLSLVQGLVGLSGLNGRGESPKYQTSVAKKSPVRSTSAFHGRKHPQIAETELVTRIELYLRSLHRSLALQRDCVVAQESARSVKARVHSVVDAFIATVGTVQHVSPVLTRLLTALTQELLAVGTLSESLDRLIRNIVSSYVHTTSFASLAFLSSPEVSAEQRLVPAITKYVSYLQKNWVQLEAECDIEHMLETCLNQDMRHTFKTAEFQSIGHLLEVCQSFRDDLQTVILPQDKGDDKESDDSGDVSQALKDLTREVIAVNGSTLPHVSSRSDLVQLLTSSLSTRPFFDATLRRRRKKNKPKRSKRSLQQRRGYSSTEEEATETDTNFTSGNEGDLSSSEYSSVNEVSMPKPRHGKFKVSTVDLLTRRLLVAASRTGTGGDAYFVVRDLFGGEDVEVVPSQQMQQPPRPPTVDLIVRLASVTIKSYSSFDIFPKSLVGDCEPLIQIHTTVTETIALQEVRTGDQGELMLQERASEKQQRKRTLSVRPALYEKSPVWHAPS